jgi:ribonuclease HI
MSANIIAYTDGSFRRELHIGGWSAVLIKDNEISEYSQGGFATDVSTMELKAIILALENTPLNSNVTIYSDAKSHVEVIQSRILSKNIKLPSKNRDTWQYLTEIMNQRNVSCVWIKGHSGIEGNVRANKLAYQALLEFKKYPHKIEHLKYIGSRFPLIQMNKYEKSLMIVLKRNGYDILTFDGIQYYVRLLLSSSFFKACIDTNFEILYDRAQIIYAYNYPLRAQEMEATLEIRYSLYKQRYPSLELSFESFKSMITQMTQRNEMYDVNSRILIKKSWTEQKPLAERFMKIWEGDILKLSNEKSDELHQETMEKDLRIYWDMNLATSQLKKFNNSSERKRYFLLFEHYLHQDILAGIASEEAINYAIETRANEESFMSSNVDDNDDPYYSAYLDGERVINDLEQASIILAKYKHPSIFGDFYKEPLATCGYILEFLDMRTDQVKKYIPLYRHGDHGYY